jgi:hypothetical protein
LSPKESKLL